MEEVRVPDVRFVIAGHGRPAMPPSIAFLTSSCAALQTPRGRLGTALTAALHLAALGLLLRSEVGLVPKLVFCFTWGLLNFFWLAVLRRPAVSAALSLAMIVVLILLSRLKYEMIWMTANFLDVMIINADTVGFLLAAQPDLYRKVLVGLALTLPALALYWWSDLVRVRRRTAATGFAACGAALFGISLAFPEEKLDPFMGEGYVSKFARSGVAAISASALAHSQKIGLYVPSEHLAWIRRPDSIDLNPTPWNITVAALQSIVTHGHVESDAAITDRLRTLPNEVCVPGGKPPHIILVHDESSFDIRVLPGIKVAADYGDHFRSFDGKRRHFISEGNGGPSWYAEYNVLAGLSARSFGRLSYYVTYIAAGRVERGLPAALRRCGYRTFSIYPEPGAFMNARNFQTTTGMERFLDRGALGTNRIEPDRFYYDAALRMIEQERDKGPMFLFVVLAANHTPWNYRWQPELMPEWKESGNAPDVDEYLRRQSMSFGAYAELLDRLARRFPGESFLLVRYGDHQPRFASLMLDLALDEAGIARRLMTYDPRYYTTYYAIDVINFKPFNLSSALDTIEGPYLPLVVQEAAGLPLDPSFAEQKQILERCKGLFYACAGGAEARRFNRLLIDAGLIKGL
jgi:Sulfatase